MSRRIVVPIQMGCCREASRCRLCPPAKSVPTAEFVTALIENYERERLQDGDLLSVGFFGGIPPSASLLEAAGGRPLAVRVRPDLLTRSEAKRLIDAGVAEIELDVLTFCDHALKSMRRLYPSKRIETMALTLAEQGVRVGMVLSPGLPHSSWATALADAEQAAELAQFVRIHPTLILADSGLSEWYTDGLYEPLTLATATEICAEMMDILEASQVSIIRVGMQAGPDGFGKALAGPKHSSMRELVEAHRTLRRLRYLLRQVPERSNVQLLCAGSDETRTRGPLNQHIRTLRAELKLAELQICVGQHLKRGQWEIRVNEVCNE